MTCEPGTAWLGACSPPRPPDGHAAAPQQPSLCCGHPPPPACLLQPCVPLDFEVHLRAVLVLDNQLDHSLLQAVHPAAFVGARGGASCTPAMAARLSPEGAALALLVARVVAAACCGTCGAEGWVRAAGWRTEGGRLASHGARPRPPAPPSAGPAGPRDRASSAAGTLTCLGSTLVSPVASSSAMALHLRRAGRGGGAAALPRAGVAVRAVRRGALWRPV
jgi:hypothetical protein